MLDFLEKRPQNTGDSSDGTESVCRMAEAADYVSEILCRSIRLSREQEPDEE